MVSNVSFWFETGGGRAGGGSLRVLLRLRRSGIEIEKGSGDSSVTKYAYGDNI